MATYDIRDTIVVAEKTTHFRRVCESFYYYYFFSVNPFRLFSVISAGVYVFEKGTSPSALSLNLI